MDHLRRACTKKSSLATEDKDFSNDEDAEPADKKPLLDKLLIRKDMNDCIRSVVQSLPGDYSTVLVLGDFEGLTNSEIADVIGISLETEKIRLHRARTKLRKALETNCNFYRDERNEFSCERKATPLKIPKK
jgi:RNA polymerase sigma-70 factor (ECF subfamily)